MELLEHQETIVQQNGGPISPNDSGESVEPQDQVTDDPEADSSSVPSTTTTPDTSMSSLSSPSPVHGTSPKASVSVISLSKDKDPGKINNEVRPEVTTENCNNESLESELNSSASSNEEYFESFAQYFEVVNEFKDSIYAVNNDHETASNESSETLVLSDNEEHYHLEYQGNGNGVDNNSYFSSDVTDNLVFRGERFLEEDPDESLGAVGRMLDNDLSEASFTPVNNTKKRNANFSTSSEECPSTERKQEKKKKRSMEQKQFTKNYYQILGKLQEAEEEKTDEDDDELYAPIEDYVKPCDPLAVSIGEDGDASSVDTKSSLH